MNQNPNPMYESEHEAEETLRLVATMPPPAELTDRVHQRLAMEKDSAPRRSFWSLWMPAQRFQFAAAAVLVVAVAGSTWSVYHTNRGSKIVAPVPHAVDSGGGFGTAGAERVPPTLNPIKVPPAPKKKPGAGRVKPGAKPSAVQASSSQVDSAQQPK
jgi:hypothetical protein